MITDILRFSLSLTQLSPPLFTALFAKQRMVEIFLSAFKADRFEGRLPFPVTPGLLV
jgi:hypothetical protein